MVDGPSIPAHMQPERQARLQQALDRRQPDLTVVLEHVEDPHNISAILRSCDSVGIQDVYVIRSITPKKRAWGWKSSGSAFLWLTVHEYDRLDTCMRDVQAAGFRCMATHLGEAAVSLFEIDFKQPVALVFGNEVQGVSAECLAYCDGNFIIPQMGLVQSLNVSVACAVSLYEALRQRQAAGYYTEPRLPEERRRQLAVEWGNYKKTRHRGGSGKE